MNETLKKNVWARSRDFITCQYAITDVKKGSKSHPTSWSTLAGRYHSRLRCRTPIRWLCLDFLVHCKLDTFTWATLLFVLDWFETPYTLMTQLFAITAYIVYILCCMGSFPLKRNFRLVRKRLTTFFFVLPHFMNVIPPLSVGLVKIRFLVENAGAVLNCHFLLYKVRWFSSLMKYKKKTPTGLKVRRHLLL